MRVSVSKSLGKQLKRPLRALVSPLLFKVKDRKTRLAILRCLVTYPEYQFRLDESRRLAIRDIKLKKYAGPIAAAFIEHRAACELASIYEDMASAYFRAAALLKFNKTLNINPDLTELHRHVFIEKPLFYL